MRFAKLRLSGFKSFVEPAELVIRDGLTGIVGPNGCGKSNLLEALRWVMGESSARSLRVAAGGAGMDDVIFAGTARRPARDIADVRLVLDNAARRAPAEFNAEDVLEISRSIGRGEGSSWSLNGREVRLRDVQLLFADAATGAHSPALVGQGRVAAIISARPQERRLLLEEAAGISGLSVRRREAETRLRAADANLARLDDVMQAAEAHAAGLRRQAKSAARYRQLSESVRTQEAALLRLQWQAAADARSHADQALREAEATLAEAVGAAARAATAQADAAAGLPGLRQAEAAAAAALQRLTTERATQLAERAALVQRLADLDAALAAAGADSERERARARDSAATQARLADDLAAQQAAAATARAAIVPLGLEVADAEQLATETERALAGAVEAHAALVADARAVRSQAEATRGRAERLETERRRLETERSRLADSGAATALRTQISETESELATRAADVEVAAAAVADAERLALGGRQAAEAVERALAAARSEIASLEAEAAALDRLRGPKAAAPRTGLRQALTADPGFEAAVAAALGEDVDAAIGRPERPARHWLRIDAAGDPGLPAGAEPLAAHVVAPSELARRLAQVGVVRDPPAPQAVAALRPGQRLVSRDGWLWRWDGFVAPPGGQSAAVAEALSQDNRRREIARLLEAPMIARQSAEAELADQKAVIAQAQQAERSARMARTEAERLREQLAGRLQGLRAADAQGLARISAMEASIERLAAEGTSASSEAKAAAEAVAGLPDASAAVEDVAAARTAAERARSRLAQARADAAGAERAAAESTARIAQLTREIGDWQTRDRDAAEAAQALSKRARGLAEEHAGQVAEPAAMAARLAHLELELRSAEAARAAAAESVIAAEIAQTELDRRARTTEALVADAREARAMRVADAGQKAERVDALVADAHERFGAAPGTLGVIEGATPEGLARTLDSMRAERERIGVVNLRADIELAEIEATVTQQAAERGELETAIHRLRGSIGALNREGRARLLAAFQQVDRHFRELFLTLFGGGTAELQLVESDDPLEAGLEIRAQPPGKKLQSLTLLSGGEQALTAIALIFALFRTNPAPICVLDEVDAPLDDANVERFTRLLLHMAETTDTRFLIVTHNAVTMAAMHRLYGVTMSEPGVSQLVSVELREAAFLAA